MAKTTKVKIGQKAEVQVIWNCKSTDYNEDALKNIKSLFAAKYEIPEGHVKVVPHFINTNENGEVSLNADTLSNINDPKFQQALFVPCLREKGIADEDYDLDELIKIDSQMNSLLDYSVYDKGRRYILKWLDWSNFLSYGEVNHFDFTTLSGLVLLNSVPANQGGKSTFAYDLLHFLFFGKTSSGKAKTLGDLFNNHLEGATTLYVKGCISIDGNDYLIQRTLTRPAAGKKNRTVTQTVEYFRLLPDGTTEALEENDNLGEENNVKTTKAIKEAIGNERDFDLVISANSDNLKELISLKETDRGRLLSRWVGLLPLEDKDIKAREKWNREISLNRYVDRYNTQTVKNEIAALEERIKSVSEAIKKDEELVGACDERLKAFNESQKTLLLSKKEIRKDLLDVDVQTLEEAIRRLIEKGKQRGAEKEQNDNKIKEIGEVEAVSDAEYKALTDKKEPLITKIADLKNEINNLKKTNKDLEESEYCPLCKRKFDNVDNTETINANKAKIQKLINEGIKVSQEKTNLETAISEMEAKRSKYNEKNRLELISSKLDVEITNLRQEYKDKKALQKEIEDNKAAIEANNQIDTSLNIVNANIANEFRIRDDANFRIADGKRDIETDKAGITDRQGILNKIEEELKVEKNWKLYLMLVGKDGISKMVLRNALPIINTEMRRFLDGVCDFDVEVEINEKNDVDFTLICSDGVRQRLAAGSGFEQTAAALALRVVLGKMSALSRPPFILLDEVLGGVAEENYDNMTKLYGRIAENYDFVLQITHLKDIIDWHTKVITVIKKNHVSRIEVKQ